jgi:hypothetical protein
MGWNNFYCDLENWVIQAYVDFKENQQCFHGFSLCVYVLRLFTN